MKRDWVLIRKLLLGIENNKQPLIEGYSTEQVNYHINLLCNGGFICHNFNGGYFYHMKGIELLNVLHGEQKFNLAMKEVEANSGAATTEVLVGLIARIP